MDLEHKINDGLANSPQKGHKIGAYVVLSPLVRRTNSVIYEGIATTYSQRDRTTDDRVLFKGLNYETLNRLLQEGNTEIAEELLKNFDEEIEFMDRLKHPNIVKSYPVIIHRGIKLIPMEPIKGRFDEAVKDLSIQELILQGCDLLEYLMAQNTVHADFKPENFPYDPSERKIKLIDFGIALDLEKDAKPKGFTSPEYIPPETKADGITVAPEYDIFSFGHVLDEAWKSQFEKHTTDRDAPTDVGGRIPKSFSGPIAISDIYLKAIVDICTAIDPKKRDLKLVRELTQRM